MWFSVALFATNSVMVGYFGMTSAQSDKVSDLLYKDLPSIALIGEKPIRASSKKEADEVAMMDMSESETLDSKAEKGTPEKQVASEVIESKPKDHTKPEKQELAEEKVPQDQPEPVPEKVPEPTMAVAKVCYESGPFTSQGSARKMQKAVQKLGVKAKIKKIIKREKLGYWVYLKPERSLALSRLKAEEVKTKGIKDVAVVIKSKPKYAISLGVFKNKKTAEARKIKAESLGFKPLLTTRYNSEAHRWVQMEMSVDKEPSEQQWKKLLKGKKGIEIKPMECK